MIKRILFPGLVVFMWAGTVLAQDQLVLKKAQQIRDGNNARQQAMNGGEPNASVTPGSAPTYTSAAPAGPQGINPLQQQLIERLESDFAIVKPGTAVTPAQMQAMVREMTSLAKGTVKPTKAELDKLSADLAAALAEKPLSIKDTTTLARDVNIVENCSVLTAARSQTYVADAQAMLRNNGISDANVQAVGADLKAIVTEIQKSKPKLYQ